MVSKFSILENTEGNYSSQLILIFYVMLLYVTDNTGQFLEWKRRHAIAIGTAKGLRFLHEECRGSPIIHRDVRPSNILLTHDFVALVNL